MKNFKCFLTVLICFFALYSFGQEKSDANKITVTGKIIEKSNQNTLEYATITLKNPENPKIIFGGISDKKGMFSIDVSSGNYDILIEFISLKSHVINNKTLTESQNLGTFGLEKNITELNEVVIRSENTTVEIKLDKKVYNVGKDLMVKGGTVSDVLDNIPSVSVDVDGSVSLRGNSNVKILVDGRPSSAINITEALRLIPADAIDKVEVITNPSARYDAEGGAGIVNVILKKGKNQGINGSIVANTGYPETYGLTGNLNYKMKKFNLFTTQGYSYRNNPGNAFVDSRYLNADVNNSTKNFMYETRDTEKLNRSYNSILGMDWLINESTTWTNSFTYRNSNGDNLDDISQDYFDVNHNYTSSRFRINNEETSSENFEYSSNLLHNFNKEGHKLTADITISSNNDLSNALINETSTLNTDVAIDKTVNDQEQNRKLFQTDYVLPLKNGAQFEAGYRGNFLDSTTDYSVLREQNPDEDLSNILEYKEKVNALYSQYGFKINKYSALFGLRWEDSNIDVNQLVTNDYNNKKYNNFFPSAFLSYEIEKGNNITASYSRRIQRPSGRQLNPFNSFSSDVNIYVGNPDLDPSLTDAIDLGYLKTWSKLTLSTSMYINKTLDVVQMVRKETGVFEDEVPVVVTTPINLATEYRTGFEFTLNYSPYQWWKLNGNFNFFYIETDGDYTEFNDVGEVIYYQNFDNSTTSWFTKLSSKITLPYKIDWQTNLNYNGNQKFAQGKSIGALSMNLAFSKDVLKDKGTINFNISDVFNSRKRKVETYLPGVVDSYSEMQWRVRQFNLSFTYRFNKAKNEKEKRPKNGQPENEGGEY